MPKMVQMSWNLDKVCISDRCIEFQMKFEKFWKLAHFWPKNDYFSRFSRFDFGTAFSTENVITPSKMLQLTWFFVYSLPIVPATKVHIGFWKFWIFSELWLILWVKRANFRQFWSFFTKNAILAYKLGHTSVKIQNF